MMRDVNATPLARKRTEPVPLPDDEMLEIGKADAILSRLKQYASKIHRRESELNRLRVLMCIDLYSWVEIIVAHYPDMTVKQACKDLVRHVGMSDRTLVQAYNTGRFIRDHRLGSTVTLRPVQLAQRNWNVLKKHARLKVLSLLKENAHSGDVARVIEDAREVSGAATHTKIKRLKRRGKWTLTQLKMEAMALRTMCEEFFGVDCTVLVRDTNTEEDLL